MSDACFTLFQTAIGACAIAWRGDRVTGTALPERSAKALRTRWPKRHPGAVETDPPPTIAHAIAAIQALLADGRGDLGGIALDFASVDDFERRVYAEARAIPPGETRTYGDIARALGDVALSRAVGKALGSNPFPIVIPCHRVLAASGKTGGFSAPGGVETKMRMLTIERARTTAEPLLFDDLALATRAGP